MEILKKLIIIIAFFCTTSAWAQISVNVQEAFKTSYAQEAYGKYSEAVKTLRKVYDADSYPINLRLGWLSYLEGQYTQSASYYNKAIKLKPLSIEAKLGLTYPESAMGNWESILSIYKSILKIDPNHYTANLKLAQIYYGRKDYLSAKKHFDLLINFYPFTYEPVIGAAWNNLKMGKTREAKVLFSYCLLLNPGDDSATKGLNAIK